MDTIPQDNTPRKQCSNPNCLQWLPATRDFFYSAKSKDGLNRQCKECVKQRVNNRYQHDADVREQQKAYQQRPEVKAKNRETARQRYADPEVQEKHRKYQRERYQQTEVREGILEYSRQPEVRTKHRERQRRYAQRPDNRAMKRVYDQEYRRRPDIQERRRQWHRAYQIEYLRRPGVRERKRDYERRYYRWCLSQPELHAKMRLYDQVYAQEYYKRPEVREKRRVYSRCYNHLRRARQKAVSGTHTPAQIQDLLKRQKHKCYYCSRKFEKKKGKSVYHVDHTFPISRVVGTDIPANDISYLVLTCPTCNRRKNDKFPWEWAEGGKLL